MLYPTGTRNSLNSQTCSRIGSCARAWTRTGISRPLLTLAGNFSHLCQRRSLQGSITSTSRNIIQPIRERNNSMAIKDNIKPTRSELIDLKKRIKLSQSGHKLLKMKRDGLILELFAILEKAKGVRAELEKQFAVASQKLAIAKSVEGLVVLKSTAFALKDTPKLELERKNVMGVVVPKIQASSVHKKLNENGH